MMNHKTSTHDEQGFSIIEVMVAILIGIIIMTSAITIIGSTNSSALRILAKSEAQQGSRSALLSVFTKLAKASSAEVCVRANSADLQKAISDGKTGRPTQDIEVADCKEVTNSGIVIVSAEPNQICYLNTSGVGPSLRFAPRIQCISMGKVDSAPIYSPHSEINISACTNSLNKDEDILYLYTCDPIGGKWLRWPSSYGPPNGEGPFLLADLGNGFKNYQDSIVDSSQKGIFTYISSKSAPTNKVTGNANDGSLEARLKDIVAVKVRLPFNYDSKTTKGNEIYFFEHTIVLNGSIYAMDEEALNE